MISATLLHPVKAEYSAWIKQGFPVLKARVKPKPAEESDAEFIAITLNMRMRLRELTERLGRGAITLDEWNDQFATILQRAHFESWIAGKVRGGDLAAPTITDAMMARAAKDAELVWLNNFTAQLMARDPRYFSEDGLLKIDAVAGRAETYSQKLRGTANVAFVETSHVLDEINWVMTTVEHCADCPRLEALSPYTKDTLFTYPGGGDTSCLFRCGCELRRSDGVNSFAMVEL